MIRFEWPDWASHFLGASVAFAWALLGRTVWRASQAQQAKYCSLGQLVWDIPIAAGMAVLGLGVADYLHLTGNAAAAEIGIMGYLGPRGLEVLLVYAARRWKGGKNV